MKKQTLAAATISEHAGVRYLHLGTPWVQGAMRLAKPDAIELDYVRRMMVWTLLRPPRDVARGHAVQLGLGAAAITRFCHGRMRMRTTAVEINRSVIDACRMWFRLGPDSARLQVLEADAAAWAADPVHAGLADVLCIDLYDHDAAAPVLDSAAFYRHCQALLVDDGVMSVNLFGRQASFERSMGRIAAAFGPGRLWYLKPTREGNTIAVATHAAVVPDRHIWQARADNIEARFGLPARKWLRLLQPWPAESPPR
jgi:spermidine synthase